MTISLDNAAALRLELNEQMQAGAHEAIVAALGAALRMAEGGGMMMQAIVTKYHGSTNTRGSRISATAEAGRIMLSWDHALNGSDNHMAAAQALADKMGWTVAAGYPALVGGALPGNAGYAFVMGS